MSSTHKVFLEVWIEGKCRDAVIGKEISLTQIESNTSTLNTNPATKNSKPSTFSSDPKFKRIDGKLPHVKSNHPKYGSCFFQAYIKD